MCYLKELKDDTGVDTFNLSVKNVFIALKAEVHKLDINKLANTPNNLTNLKTNVDDLDVGVDLVVPVDLKKIK